MKISKNKKIILAIIFGLFLIASIISYFSPVSGDACWHVFAGKYIGREFRLPFDEPLGRDELFWPPFLFHLVVGIFENISILTNFDLIFLILPLAYLGSLWFLYLLIKEDFNFKEIVIALLFTALYPMFLDYFTNYDPLGLLTFFVIGSVYFAKKNKVLLGGIFFGLAIFTKFNGFMILPCLIYLLYRNNKLKLKQYVLFSLASLFGLIPYIRSYVVFGNPVWPFLNNLFNGMKIEQEFYHATIPFDALKILIDSLAQFTGIPLNIEMASRLIYDITSLNLKFLIYIYVTFTAVFLLFIAINGFKNLKGEKNYILLWGLGFLILQVVYIVATHVTFMRFFMPFIPALGILFARGSGNLLKRYKKKEIFLYLILAVILVIFLSATFAKHMIAKVSWDKYEKDFKFAKENSDKDALFYYGGQCFSINTNRHSTQLPSKLSEAKKDAIIFFNENFPIEIQAQVSASQQEEIIKETNCTIIYMNNETKTKYCKI